MGSSLGEYPAATVELSAGGKFQTVLSGTLSDYYDLKVGEYYLRFVYDIRLLDNRQRAELHQKRLHGGNRVLWDTRWHRLSIVKKERGGSVCESRQNRLDTVQKCGEDRRRSCPGKLASNSKALSIISLTEAIIASRFFAMIRIENGS
jgi:hypothetical protein